MKNHDHPNSPSIGDVSSLLRDKQVRYSDLANVLADLRQTAKNAPEDAIGEALAAAVRARQPVTPTPASSESAVSVAQAAPAPAHPSSPAPSSGSVSPTPEESTGTRWSDRFFKQINRETKVPVVIPNPVTTTSAAAPADPETVRSQLSALEASLKREQRYRQQFEEASAKAALAERLERKLATSQAAVVALRERETALLADLESLQAEARNAAAIADGLVNRQSELAEARAQIASLESRLKEAEHKGALAGHLELELTRTRTDLEQAKIRERQLQVAIAEARSASETADGAKAELLALRESLADAHNREETLQIQLAEVQGAVSLARQVEEELAASRAELTQTHARIAMLEAEVEGKTFALEQARTLTVELEAVRSRLTETTDAILDLQAQLATARREAADAPALRQEIERLHQRATAAENRSRELEAAGSDSVAALRRAEAAESDLAHLRSALTRLEHDCATLRGELDRAKQSAIRVHELDARIAIQDGALAAARGREQALTDALQSAKGQIADFDLLTARLAEETERRTALEASIEVLTNDLKATRKALAASSEKVAAIPSMEAEISALQSELADSTRREQELSDTIAETEAKLADAIRAASKASLSESANRAALDADVANLKRELATVTAELTRTRAESDALTARESARLAEQIARTDAVQSELVALRNQFSRIESDLARTQHELAEARLNASAVEPLRSELLERNAAHAAATAKISELTASIESIRGELSQEKSRASAVEAEAIAERTSLEARCERLKSESAELAAKLAEAEATAARAVALESELTQIKQSLQDAQSRETKLQTEKLAIQRATAEVAARLSSAPATPRAPIAWTPEPPSPLEQLRQRLTRPVIWVGHHPRTTLAAAAIAVVCTVAAGFFLLTPSYPAIVDAPVIRMESPVSGTVLTAGGEPGMTVRKDELLFSIKNANDSREVVRKAREVKVGLEEEVKYLESAQSALARKQLALGMPDVPAVAAPAATWLADAEVRKATAVEPGTGVWAPDAPDTETADYLALRISENTAKLDAARQKLAAAEAEFTAAEEHFRKTEKAEVRAPTMGVIQSMRVTPGTPVEEGTVLCEVIDSSAVFIEAAFPAHLVDGEDAIGRRVQITLQDSRTTFEGEIVTVGYTPDASSTQTAVSLDDIKEGYLIVSIRITHSAWIGGDSGLASQVGRRAKAKLL